MPTKIAVTHPGKQGDALYALPTLRALCELNGCQADFYTSEYCAPLKGLFEYQDAIDHFYVAPNYVIERMDMGVQPAYVPVDASLYACVYQLGYRGTPDCPLPEFIARSVGAVKLGGMQVTYQSPPSNPRWDLEREKDYLVLAPRGQTSYTDLFKALIEQAPMRVVLVGGRGDSTPFLGLHNMTDLTGWGYLEVAYVLSRAQAFVGLMSSQLALANGFPIPRIVPHDGIHWDMRHVVQSPLNHYLVNPNLQDILAQLP